MMGTTCDRAMTARISTTRGCKSIETDPTHLSCAVVLISVIVLGGLVAYGLASSILGGA